MWLLQSIITSANQVVHLPMMSLMLNIGRLRNIHWYIRLIDLKRFIQEKMVASVNIFGWH